MNLFPAFGIISLILLMGCSGMEQSEREKVRRLNCIGEPIYRNHKDVLYQLRPLVHTPRAKYPWESEVHLPRITKDFFRCKGNPFNPPYAVPEDQSALSDCEGCSRHGFPVIHGKENVYPILIDLLNYVQQKTGKRVVITCGHRCPQHNRYSDPSKENLTSKHQVGAEVDFYVQGMEDRPLEVVGILMQYYQENEAKEYREFKRLERDKQTTSLWMNKEILIQLYQKTEGRDLDNRHPHPYLSIQVRYDREKRERVLYSWKQAHQGYPRF